jgi:hypothetical protein
LRHIFDIRFDGGLKVGAASCVNCRLNGGDERIDMRRGFRLRVERFLRGLDGTAALVAQNDNKPGAKVVDCVLDAGEDVIVQNITRDPHDE